MTEPVTGPVPGPVPEQVAQPAGLPYHRIHRGGAWGRHGWWRGLVGVVCLAGLALFVQLVALVGVAAWYLLTGVGLDQVEGRLAGNPVTPGFLLAVNLGWALAIPAVWLVTLLHGLRPRWVASVVPRIRWGWFLRCLGIALVALVATIGVSMLVPTDAAGTEMSGELNDFTERTRDFLLVIVLFTPLQAAGEEYLFRGYLTQALGGLFANRHVSVSVAVLVPSLLFALAHGAQDAPIFVDRFAFGLVAGVLVIVTGGLEAGIAMHVLNNFVAFGFALSFGDIDSALNPSGGSWWSLPTTLTQSLVYLGLAAYLARRVRLRTRTASGVLAGPAARV